MLKFNLNAFCFTCLIIEKITKSLNYYYFKIRERFYFKINELNNFVKLTKLKKFTINIIKFIKYNKIIVKVYIYVIIILIIFIINVNNNNID